jgi:hypothetical protein
LGSPQAVSSLVIASIAAAVGYAGYTKLLTQRFMIADISTLACSNANAIGKGFSAQAALHARPDPTKYAQCSHMEADNRPAVCNPRRSTMFSK